MADALLVFCTTPNHAEASKLARSLVKEHAAACVNILPAVESIYRWQEEIETAAEVLLVIKTTRERFPGLRDLILQLHSYETPEVIAVPIVDGSAKYLAWLGESVA